MMLLMSYELICLYFVLHQRKACSFPLMKIKHKQPYGYNNIIEKQEKPTI